jgi:hypothetical protein
MTQVDPGTHLRDTQDAFDSVAADYDGPRGNNSLIQDMRDVVLVGQDLRPR